MKITIGLIPYLNMVPFHQGFGPETLHQDGVTLQFRSVSPRALGLEAESGRIDAGAMSLVDTFRLADTFEPLGNLGIGVKREAGSVLLFSKVPLEEFQGFCAVTDETSTSVQLLQVLLEKRYHRPSVRFGRIASGALYDGSADALLLIGDEALKVRRTGMRELPVVTDLATEWHAWQGTPFVFARWMVRKGLPISVKNLLYGLLKNSLETDLFASTRLLNKEAEMRGFTASEIADYWNGFVLDLTPAHDRAVKQFREFVCPSLEVPLSRE